MCEEKLRRHLRSTIFMKDIDVNVYLCKYVQEPEVIRVTRNRKYDHIYIIFNVIESHLKKEKGT